MTINTNADLTLIANEASVTHNMFIKATLDDYKADSRQVYTAVDIVINQVACDCSSLKWQNPNSGVDITGTAIMAGTNASDKTLTMPRTDDSNKNTIPAFQKCYEGGGSCSADGQITSITWKYGTNAATTKPNWITWPVNSNDINSDNSQRQTKITINPANGQVIGTHSIIAVWTPKFGSAYTYTALTFSVNCEVTSFTKPSAPVHG